jgi:hypothetical protein
MLTNCRVSLSLALFLGLQTQQQAGALSNVLL